MLTQGALVNLAGITDPQEKRKIIGSSFIDVFEEQAEALGQVDFLAQGTLYPDVIESVSVVGQSAMIKSHHNVGGLPARMRMTLVEPLRDTLVQAMLPSPMFGNRWRWNATRGLALLRRTGGRKVPAPILRMRSDDLLAAVFPDQVACQENRSGPIEPPDHPLVNETILNCLHEAMDLDGLIAIVEGRGAGADLAQLDDELLAADVRRAAGPNADLALAPVVATATEPEPPPINIYAPETPAIVASVSAGLPVWPAAMVAAQAHFTAASLTDASPAR